MRLSFDAVPRVDVILVRKHLVNGRIKTVFVDKFGLPSELGTNRNGFLQARSELIGDIHGVNFRPSASVGCESYSAQWQDGFPRAHQNVSLRLSMT